VYYRSTVTVVRTARCSFRWRRGRRDTPFGQALWTLDTFGFPMVVLGLRDFLCEEEVSNTYGHHANGWTHKVLLPDVELLAVLFQANSVCVCNL
jgi:hypothetical protein